MNDFLNLAIEKLANQSQQPPEQKRSAKAQECAKAIKDLTLQAVVNFVNTTNAGFDLVWKNQFGLAPQEVCDALGVEALGVFARHRAASEFLTAQAPAVAALLRTVPEGYEISYEMADGKPTGRVTITETE